jgi:LemA protein
LNLLAGVWIGPIRMAPVLVGFAVLAVFVLAVVAVFNQLASLGVQSDGAWADIEVQLKRRHDLVPNLVATVQGYAGHEQKTLQAVVEARNAAIHATAPGQQQQAERQLSASLGQLFALVEAYPALRSVESFVSLQQDLAAIELDLQNVRRYYNAVVRDLNTATVQFPSNLVASLAGFRPRSFFELADRAEADAPRVRFDG